MLIVSGCEAKSSVTVTLQDNASGSVVVLLELDSEAASALQRDAYDPTTIDELFNTKELEQAGFDVVVIDEDDGGVAVSIATDFHSEEELQQALAVISTPEVIAATLDASQNFVKEEKSASLTVDLGALKDMYLDDGDIKEKVLGAGIEPQEYEGIVNQAFDATTLTLTMASGANKDSGEIKGSSPEAKTVEISSSAVRWKYVLNIAGAALCFILGAIIIWRLCRKPRLLSKIDSSDEASTTSEG